MFQHRVRLFTILGFEVKVDISWLILAVLITWTLARGVFPYYDKGLSEATYWWMGAAGAIGLFLSIIFHELAHSLVARRYGLQIKGITLFIFGGVAEMHEEPSNPRTEFLMAAAGPFSSIVLGVIFYLLRWAGAAAAYPRPVVYVLGYLSFLNFILAGFNLLPAFPLDGGRIFRAALWKWKHNLRWATRVASQAGSFFGMALIFLGFLSVLQGNFIGGIWWFLIGMFLRNASRISYKQVLLRKSLKGEKIARFATVNPITVPPSISIEELVNGYIYKYHHKLYPVTEDGRLLGCMTLAQIKEVPRELWSVRTVREAMSACSPRNSVSPDADAVTVLSLMQQTGNSRLLVVAGGELKGIITLKDILGFLSLKLDLEGEGDVSEST